MQDYMSRRVQRRMLPLTKVYIMCYSSTTADLDQIASDVRRLKYYVQLVLQFQVRRLNSVSLDCLRAPRWARHKNCFHVHYRVATSGPVPRNLRMRCYIAVRKRSVIIIIITAMNNVLLAMSCGAFITLIDDVFSGTKNL